MKLAEELELFEQLLLLKSLIGESFECCLISFVEIFQFQNFSGFWGQTKSSGRIALCIFLLFSKSSFLYLLQCHESPSFSNVSIQLSFSKLLL